MGRFDTIIGEVGDLLGTGLLVLGAFLIIMGVANYFTAKANNDDNKQNTATMSMAGGIVLAILGIAIATNFLTWIQSVMA